MTSYDDYVHMLTACYPDLPIRDYRPAQQGWDSITLFVNDDMIFRFARRPDVAEQLAREARLLPALAQTLPVAIPRFEYVCAEPAGGVRFVGYHAIGGAPLSPESFSPAHAAELAQQLGVFLTALHSFPVTEATQLGVVGGSADDWRREYVAFFGEVREHIFLLLSETERSQVAARWERYLGNSANFTFAPALIHRDLAPEHILHEPETGQLSGVIDWGDASLGDPAQDFTGLHRELGQEFAASVFAHYQRAIKGDVETFWQRVRFYGSIGPLHEIRFGQLSGDDEHIAHGLAALHRQLEHI